jgi:tRNA-2-methylthio-N6-dimethylallyladenosine synthase
VLAAMKRGYTALEYKSIVRRLRAARPGHLDLIDFIVGFPGETEDDFEATMKLSTTSASTPASASSTARARHAGRERWPTTTPAPVKLAPARLQERIDEQAQAISRAMVGTRQRVLVEGPARRTPPSSPAHRQQPRREFPRPRGSSASSSMS